MATKSSSLQQEPQRPIQQAPRVTATTRAAASAAAATAPTVVVPASTSLTLVASDHAPFSTSHSAALLQIKQAEKEAKQMQANEDEEFQRAILLCGGGGVQRPSSVRKHDNNAAVVGIGSLDALVVGMHGADKQKHEVRHGKNKHLTRNSEKKKNTTKKRQQQGVAKARVPCKKASKPRNKY
jgi:hypothetical protein